MWRWLLLWLFFSDISTLEFSSVLDGAMLEQQDSADCDYGGTTKTNINNNNVDNNTPSVPNNGVVVNGVVDENDGTLTPTSNNLPPASSSTTTSTTTVRIHTTYKKRASKFMNRPNVQNGLGANSLLNPYGATGGIGGGGSGGGSPSVGVGANISGGSRLFNSHGGSQPPVNSLFNNRNTNHHRSLTTRSSLFGGGSGGGGITSPQGTTTGSTTTTTVESRPPFVTTVTRGRFLPSKFEMMVEKSLFTFSSRPKPVGLITRHQCSLSGGPLKENTSQNCQPRGAHDYFNVMWDPHVYRGSTTTLTSSLKQPENELISSKDQDRRRRRRAFLNGGVSNNLTGSNSNVSPVGAIGPTTTNSNRNRYRMTTKVTSRSRTFPPPEGRHQVHVQTDEYLEDLTRDVNASRGPDVDAIVQTDPIEDDDLLTSSGFHPELKSGIDASTQVLPGELFSFDERVQPVVEAVVGKILEQALLETMEEEEIAALKAQQNRFLEKRKEEERELKRLQEQQERISAEKERLKRHLEIQFARQQQQQPQNHNGDEEALLSPLSSSLFNSANNNGTMMMGLNDPANSDGTGGGGGNNLGGGTAMSTSYLLELLPSVINSLRQEGFIIDQLGDGALSSFVPLWTSSSSKPDESSNGELAIDDIPDANDDDEDSSNQVLDGCRSRASSLDIPAQPSPALEQEKELEPQSSDQIDTEIETQVKENEPSPTVMEEEEGDVDANKEIHEEADATEAEPLMSEESSLKPEEDADPVTETAPETSGNDAVEEEVKDQDQVQEEEPIKESEDVDADACPSTPTPTPNVDVSSEENNNPPESLSLSQLPNGAIPNLEPNQD